jgi:hypothetical protein
VEGFRDRKNTTTPQLCIWSVVERTAYTHITTRLYSHDGLHSFLPYIIHTLLDLSISLFAILVLNWYQKPLRRCNMCLAEGRLKADNPHAYGRPKSYVYTCVDGEHVWGKLGRASHNHSLHAYAPFMVRILVYVIHSLLDLTPILYYTDPRLL